MKKCLVVLFMSLVLVVTMLPGVRASGLICFVGINDTIPISLPAEEAPYYSGGTLYIPYTAFNANPNGVVISNNVDQKTLVLFTRNSRLVYDLEADTVTDEENKTYRCKYCEKVARPQEMLQYGVRGNLNLSVCRECEDIHKEETRKKFL